MTVTVGSDQTPNCGTATADVTITVNPLPELTVTPASQTVCKGVEMTEMLISVSNADITTVTVTGQLPAGVSLSDDKTKISGTPTESGTFPASCSWASPP